MPIAHAGTFRHKLAILRDYGMFYLACVDHEIFGGIVEQELVAFYSNICISLPATLIDVE